jgi:GGDEF domain-containing protein
MNSDIDSITGLRAKKAFERDLDSGALRASSVLRLDFDCLSRLNVSQSVQFVDNLLKTTAQRAIELFEGGQVYRLHVGGFTVFSTATIEMLEQQTRTFQKYVAALQAPEGTPARLTVSAVLIPARRDDEGVAHRLQAADSQLKQLKQVPRAVLQQRNTP